MTFALILEHLLAHRDLERAASRDAMSRIMAGEWTAAQIAAFLIALRAKGETADEIAGLAESMRAHAIGVTLPDFPDAIDTCGTGGDGAGTFNISTCAAFVAAGAGARVAKHGNRAVTSRCGSADVLEALGLRIDLEPARIARLVGEAGFGFLFAPAHHAAMRHAAPVRRELGVRTVMNLLGPLANPAGVRRQVVGLFDARLCATVATALGRMGAVAAIAVAGGDGLDEITTTGETTVARLAADGSVVTESWGPGTFGLERARADDLRGGDRETNARIVVAILDGERGPRRDIVIANAAAALVAAGIAADPREGAERARDSLDSGRARGVLELLRRLTAEENTRTE